jgi:hypothetical protein
MKKSKIEILLIFSTIFSLILLYAFSDFEYKELKTIKDCHGKIKTKILIKETFLSKKGKYFGKSDNLLIYLDNYKYIEKGDYVYIFGKGSLKNTTCFVFPDKITILDVES